MSRCLALVLVLLLAWVPAHSQVQRQFPQNALRGELRLTNTAEAVLNGVPVRLAPGARFRGTSNMLQMSGELVGLPLTVNYTTDLYGQLRDVWILREDEARVRPWPRTATEAQTWTFDATRQIWSKP